MSKRRRGQRHHIRAKKRQLVTVSLNGNWSGTEALGCFSRGQGDRPSLREAAPCPETRMSDFASCFTSPSCSHVTDSSAWGEAESLASCPQGTGGPVTSPCHFSEPGMLLTVHAASLRLTEFITGMEGECIHSTMPLNSCYSFCFTPV